MKKMAKLDRLGRKILFNFTHPYYKLMNKEFTTIRSVNYMKKMGFSLNETGVIQLEGKFLKNAKVIGYIDKPIDEFRLVELKQDAEYPTFFIHSHQNFVDLLNSFIKWNSNHLKCVKRMYYIMEVD